MPSAPRSRSSSRLARAAGAERMALLRERDRLARRRDAAARQLAVLEEQLAEVDERLALIDRLVPEAANVHPLPARSATDGLRGAAIRRAAVEVLRARPEGAAAPIHYRAWFAAMRDAGRPVAGKDPLAVFLTQVSRSPLVVRTEEPGVYRLDLTVPARLRERLAQLQEQLADASAAADRAARDRLVAEIAAAERALDEAEAALGDAGDGARAGGDGARTGGGGAGERAAG